MASKHTNNYKHHLLFVWAAGVKSLPEIYKIYSRQMKKNEQTNKTH